MPSKISTLFPEDLAKNSPTITCSFDYLEKANRYNSEKLYYFSEPLNKEHKQARTNLAYTTHENIQLRDLRGQKHNLKLD